MAMPSLVHRSRKVFSIAVADEKVSQASSSPPSGSMVDTDTDMWEVVGGALEGGILVRAGIEFTSSLAASRLSRGAIVRALEILGNRMLFKRISGTGPRTGWVSIRQKDRPLLVWRGKALVGNDSVFDWDALEESESHDSRRRARSLPPKRHHAPAAEISPFQNDPGLNWDALEESDSQGLRWHDRSLPPRRHHSPAAETSACTIPSSEPEGVPEIDGGSSLANPTAGSLEEQVVEAREELLSSSDPAASVTHAHPATYNAWSSVTPAMCNAAFSACSFVAPLACSTVGSVVQTPRSSNWGTPRSSVSSIACQTICSSEDLATELPADSSTAGINSEDLACSNSEDSASESPDELPNGEAPGGGVGIANTSIEVSPGTPDKQAADGDFGKWVEHRKPLLRMNSGSSGRSWDFPLSKSEKRELLLLHVAAGERASADAAMASAEAAAFEAAERSRVEAELMNTTRAIRDGSIRSRFSRSGGLARKHGRLSIARKPRRVSIQ